MRMSSWQQLQRSEHGMADDLRAQLEEFQHFFETVKGDLDQLSKEQQEVLRGALRRIDEQQIAQIRASLGLPTKS